MRNLHRLLTLPVIFIFCSCGSEKSSISLPSIFSDNMVMQQNTEAAVWGKARARSKIHIKGSWGETIKTDVSREGNWMAKIKTPVAGGPYKLEISNKDTIISINNIMTGEVWICSGQSNMNMPMNGFSPNDSICYATHEIENADYPAIRMFTVNQSVSSKPEDNCQGSWDVCSPFTVGTFSATAFFFGKKLQDELGVPVGLIHSSWGGTPVESWMSGKFLIKDQNFAGLIQTLEEDSLAYQDYAKWLKSKVKIEVPDMGANEPFNGLDLKDDICSRSDFDDSKCQSMNLPGFWEKNNLNNFDGTIWFRKQISIPENWMGRELEMGLGPIDDMDAVYFNGVKIGGYEAKGFYNVPRIYKIPADLVNSKHNVIAVRVIDFLGPGGICGEAEQMVIQSAGDTNKISLAGEWKYQVVAEFYNYAFYLLDPLCDEYMDRPHLKIPFHPYSPTMLYNAMLAPLIPYTMKGAIWYQGEANVRRAKQYSRLFPLMIENWRDDWQLGNFPFYYVQIAPYKYSRPENTESAELRDAQRRTLNVLNTGMAVTLDIGNVNNIHPADKKDVGDRLAFWALANDYDVEQVFSGPLFKSIRVEKDKIRVYFDHADKGLKFFGQELEGFEIAGQDGHFVKANAKIENNNQVVVYSDEIREPFHVRYAFHNGSEATLFNVEGLPASSFTSEPVLP